MQFIKKTIMAVLMVESRLILQKYKPFIIAVTGSVGKTATKDAIFCALSSSGHVRKSEKSFNSEIGLPLTIIGVPNAWKSLSGWLRNIGEGARLIVCRTKAGAYPDILVLEIGADHPGDIKRVTKWLKPDIAVIARVGEKPVHVEFFDSPAQVFEEKSALAYAIKPGGSAVLFADEPKVLALGEELKKRGIYAYSFGLSEGATVRGADYAVAYADKADGSIGADGQRAPIGCTFSSFGSSIMVRNVIGRTFMYPLLAAIAVARIRGLDMVEIIKNINEYLPPRGRMNIIAGINESTLIDDTYNSSPDAVIAALEALKSLNRSGRKIAVLGDMMELGSFSAEEHRNIGTIIGDVSNSGVDLLITVGPRARAIAEEALKVGMSTDAVMQYSSSIEAAGALVDIIKTGDIALIKGSQSVRMERITKALMADPSRASELLVRQEREWLEKK
jgi:UDP-N-acetylmuramoyl-tripeptide--D-alanyl-D-alanine ligase